MNLSMTRTFYSILILITLSNCYGYQHNDDRTMFFGKETTINSPEELLNGWNCSSNNVLIDPSQVVNGQYSLRFDLKPADKVEVFYKQPVNNIVGDSITFSGRYRCESKGDIRLSFKIIQFLETGEFVENSIESYSCRSQWNNFEIKCKMNDLASFLFFTLEASGNKAILLNNCRVWIDNRTLGEIINRVYPAKNDTSFDKSSNVVIPDTSVQMVSKLKSLCKIWGFLKYYHPQIAKGNYNFDYELFRVIPLVLPSRNRKEFNDVIKTWIEKYGRLDAAIDTIDLNNYSRKIDLNWINDSTLFDTELIEKLNQIRSASRSYKFNYYVIPQVTNFRANIFENERSYQDISWEDQGFRLLTLFRYWNIIEYCYPYVDLIDDSRTSSWDKILDYYIPQFIHVDNKENYNSLVRELVYRVNDAHIQLRFLREGSSNKNNRLTYRKYINASLKYTDDKKIVVHSSSNRELRRGDILLKVDGVCVDSLINQQFQYFASLNHSSRISRALNSLLRTNNDTIRIVCLRNKIITHIDAKTEVSSINRNKYISQEKKKWSDYHAEGDRVAYLNIGKYDSTQIAHFKTNMNNYSGLIIDMRTYPDLRYMRSLSEVLFPKNIEFAWLSKNTPALPGNFRLSAVANIGTDNPNYFKGRIAILVDENTISHGEFSAMAYRKAPLAMVIGNKTVGADGDIGTFYLPGGNVVTYTAIGVYYPNWKICQRSGITIDIKVTPTLQELKNGQDIWIEKALQYINSEEV